jgi:hypothetical protein
MMVKKVKNEKEVKNEKNIKKIKKGGEAMRKENQKGGVMLKRNKNLNANLKTYFALKFLSETH